MPPPKEKPLISAQLHKFLNAASVIHQDPDDSEVAFMARQLVLCTLPHSNPGDIPVWIRRNNNLILGIVPAVDLRTGKSIGFPYGTIPRLLLFWIITEAVRTSTRRLQLGRSLAEFMSELDLNPANGTGKRSDARRLREQMKRLFRARISFDWDRQFDSQSVEGWLDMDIAPTGEFWWDTKSPAQSALWESWIELGEKFFHAITAAPVPLDMRALRALKRSPLALDLYAWSTYRTFAATKKGQPQFTSWNQLARQLGTDYAHPRDFKAHAQEALRKIQTVYPDLIMTKARDGFTVHPSRPAVRSRQ